MSATGFESVMHSKMFRTLALAVGVAVTAAPTWQQEDRPADPAQKLADTLQKIDRVSALDNKGELTRAEEMAVNGGLTKALHEHGVRFSLLDYQDRQARKRHDAECAVAPGNIPPIRPTQCYDPVPAATTLASYLPPIVTRQIDLSEAKTRVNEKCHAGEESCKILVVRLDEVLNRFPQTEAAEPAQP